MNPIGRALNFNEVLQYKKVLQNHLIGAQLQDVVMVESSILFKFYLQGHLTLILDSTQARPLILLFEREIKLKSIGPKPLSLFLKSHTVGKRLTDVRVKENFGRVLELIFAGGQSVIEVRLIPKAFNVLVFSEGKKISLFKPLELKEQDNAIYQEQGSVIHHEQDKTIYHELGSTTHQKQGKATNLENKNLATVEDNNLKKNISAQTDSSFDFIKLSEDWLRSKNINSSNKKNAFGVSKSQGIDSSSTEQKELDKILKKKRNAIATLESQLANDESVEYYNLGEELKLLSQSDFLKLFNESSSKLHMLDKTKSKSENIQKCFEKAKQINRKREGTQARLEILKKEVADLESGILPLQKNSLAPKSLASKSGEIKTRKLILEDIEAYMGRSAQDNLLLLRKSQPWDLWLHLKDYPSTHVIVRRNKNRNISMDEIKKISKWLVKESKGIGKVVSGQAFSVIYTECRFVKPIKGSVGLVNYHEHKEINVCID